MGSGRRAAPQPVGACPSPRCVFAGAPGHGREVWIRCRKRTCPSCGLLWAGDTRRRILANVEAYDGPVGLATITAPGRDRLPWDVDLETGEVLGQVDAEAAATWNRTAPKRWRKAHRAARAAALRKHGVCTILGRTWEYQRRGVLHVHVVLGMKTARERAAAHTYLLAMERLTGRHDFGFVSDTRRDGRWRRVGPEVIAAERAGRYVAKYLSPLGADGKPTLSETVTRPDVPRQVVHISRELTAKTGVTMRSLRAWRHAHAIAGAFGMPPLELIFGLVDGDIVLPVSRPDVLALSRLVRGP